MDLTWVCSG
ncbi:TPA_asm: UL41 uoORF [Human alphaherpesvirus 1]|nr:TPA_asm: UL41 uoORF [Human alphaherpesvirus 1]